MKGLLIKDMINLKKQSIIVMGIIMIYVLFFVISSSNSEDLIESVSAVTGMLSVVCLILSITSFSYDDVAKWDKYVASLPITRKHIVISKYILFIMIALIGMIFSLLFNIIINMYLNPESLSGNIISIIITSYSTLAISLILSSILAPFIYKFGVEKSRIILIVVYMVPVMAVMLIAKSNFFNMSNSTLELLYKILPAIIIVLPIIVVIISFFVSYNIYKNKEL